MVPATAIQTLTGHFDFINLDSNRISIVEIASVLSKICRFNGHITKFYSVGAHCLLIEDMMRRDGLSKRLRLLGLLHDSHEAYVQDMSRPLKKFLKQNYNFDLNEYCNKIDGIIYSELGIDQPNDEEHNIIKFYDDKALFIEKDHLFSLDLDWGWTIPYHFNDFDSKFLNDIEGKRVITEFIEKYKELTNARN